MNFEWNFKLGDAQSIACRSWSYNVWHQSWEASFL